MAIKDLVPKFGRDRDRVPVRKGQWDPFKDFQREMNRLFEDFFSDFPMARRHSPGLRWGDDEWGLGSAAFSPRVDIAESDREVTVSAELPGMDADDVTVEVDEGTLTIRGEKKDEQEEKGKSWYRREQSYGSFQRVVALPAAVDAARAKAKFKKGLLTVTAAKLEQAPESGKTIEIESD
jgi:HSP20 family protein